MKLEKLLTTTEFVKWYRKEISISESVGNAVTFMKGVLNYAKFISQPLTLDMFVASDKDEVLFRDWEIDNTRAALCIHNTVTDERLTIQDGNIHPSFKTLEDLIRFELVLTDECLNLLNLN